MRSNIAATDHCQSRNAFLAPPVMSPRVAIAAASRVIRMSRKLLDPPVLYLGGELNIGVGVGFGAGAGMGYRTLLGIADGLGVFPQGA